MLRSIAKVLMAVVLAGPLAAAELGDDGLHKTSWMRDTFKDLREDLEEANGEGKRLALIFEQRGCVYCTKMHEEIFPRPEISQYIEDNFFVVQLNLYGDVEVTDFDGETLAEKDMARKWGCCSRRRFCSCPKRWGTMPQRPRPRWRSCLAHLAREPRRTCLHGSMKSAMRLITGKISSAITRAAFRSATMGPQTDDLRIIYKNSQ